MARSQSRPRWEAFGKQLRHCRNSAKPNRLTQSELADGLDIAPSLISKYEGGYLHPNRERLHQIIEILEQRLVDREELGKLREAYVGPDDTPASDSFDPTLRFVSQAFKNPNLDVAGERKAFIEDIERLVKAWSLLWDAQEKLEKEKLQLAQVEFDNLSGQFTKLGERLHTRILEGVGKLQWYQGSSEAALDYLGAALAGNDDVDMLKKANIHRTRGNIYRRQGHWQNAEKEYQRSLDIYRRAKEQKKIADLYRKFAGLHIRQGKFDEGFEFCSKSIEICEEQNYRHGYRKGLQMRAWGLALQGYFGEAIEEEMEAITIVKDLKARRRDLAKAHLYLGDYLLGAKRLDEAEDAYRKAEGFLAEAFEPNELEKERLIYPMILHGRGNVYLEQGRYTEARTYFQKSLRLNNLAGDKYYKALNLRQLGRQEMASYDLAGAREKFDEAFQLFADEDGPVSVYQQAIILVDKALLCLCQRAYFEGTGHAEKAIDIGEQYDFKPTLAKARVVLAAIKLEAADCQDDLKEALSFDLRAVETTLGLHVGVTSEILKEIRGHLESLVRDDRVNDALFVSKQIVDTWPQKIEYARSPARKALQNWFIEIERFYIQLLSTK